MTECRLDEQIYSPGIKPTDAEYVNSILQPDLYLVVLKEGFGQIIHKEAKKANTIEILAGYWGIDRNGIVVFGDNLNDVNMLSWSNNRIAMGNAIDEVKAAADYICDTNNNDGIAKWLEGNVLCN